jgi:hypothetical protein
MQHILSQVLPGRIPYLDLKNASVEDFLSEFEGGTGVIHVSRMYIPYDEIFWGETEDNPARAKGSTKNNIKALASSRKQGIDPKAKLPTVEETVITDIDGNVFRYKAENGITRKKADFYNGYIDGAWFDVVRYIETEGRSAKYNRIVWLHLENDPLPQEGNSVDDLVQTSCELIASGDLAREESAIRDFVYESAPNMPTQDKNEVVRIVLKQEDIPTRTISWRDNECREWLDEKCLDNVDVDYCFPFHYFQDRVYSLLKQYHLTKEEQFVVQHFDNKGDSGEVIKASRISQKQKWEEFREIMESVAKYMVLNNWELPIDKDQYFPQIKTGDDAEDANRIVFDN